MTTHLEARDSATLAFFTFTTSIAVANWISIQHFPSIYRSINMPPVEEIDIIKKRKALEIPLEPEPDAFAALTPRGSSPINKKSRIQIDSK